MVLLAHPACPLPCWPTLPASSPASPSLAGMSWSGFRPSDDPQQYGYNIPVNMYAQAALERTLELNAAIWRSRDFEDRAGALAESMREGGAGGRAGMVGWVGGKIVVQLTSGMCTVRPANAALAGCPPSCLQASRRGGLLMSMAPRCMHMRWMAWATHWCVEGS
jgi:hypothetical protein